MSCGGGTDGNSVVLGAHLVEHVPHGQKAKSLLQQLKFNSSMLRVVLFLTPQIKVKNAPTPKQLPGSECGMFSSCFLVWWWSIIFCSSDTKIKLHQDHPSLLMS